MWHALRAELLYFRPWLLGGLGIGAGVVLMVSAIFYAVGDEGPPSHAAAGIRGMFLMMAPLIVGFVVQTYRFEERRTRLLFAGSLTPRQLAGVLVLLPLILGVIGLFAAALVLGLDFLVSGELAIESLHIGGYVGGLLFMMLMMGLLVQEATAAHLQRRRRAAAGGWAVFVLAVLVLVLLSLAAFVVQGPLTWPSLHLGNLLAAATAAIAGMALFVGRTDFTR